MTVIRGKFIGTSEIKEYHLDINNTPTDGYILAWSDSANKMVWIAANASDAHDLKVSANDTTPGYLNGKLVGTTGKVTLTENNNGANETLTVNIGADVFDKTSNTTDNITEGTTKKFYSDTLVSTYISTIKGAASGIASLGADSKIPTSQLPALAITSTYVVASQVAQLALTVQEGDVAVRTDLNKSYIALNSTNGSMSDWQELLTPTDTVTSVNGATGAVSLNTDNVSEGSTNKYYTDTRARGALSAGTGISYNSGTGVISISGSLGQTKKVEIVTLTSTHISQKYVDLTQTPVDGTAVELCPAGGIPQVYGTDFTVITNGSVVKRVNWSGLGLDTVLEADDKVIISYTY